MVTMVSPLLCSADGREDALIVVLSLRLDTHVYSKRNDTEWSGAVAAAHYLMSGISVALLFAYLAVRPTGASGDRGRGQTHRGQTSNGCEGGVCGSRET